MAAFLGNESRRASFACKAAAMLPLLDARRKDNSGLFFLGFGNADLGSCEAPRWSACQARSSFTRVFCSLGK